MTRRLLLTALLTIALGLGTARAANVIVVETVTFGASAVGFSVAGILTGVPMVNVCEGRADSTGGEFRYTYDGTTPDATTGTQVEPLDPVVITGHDNILRFKGIRTGATSGKVRFTCVDK
jgi:hypothetical protein